MQERVFPYSLSLLFFFLLSFLSNTQVVWSLPWYIRTESTDCGGKCEGEATVCWSNIRHSVLWNIFAHFWGWIILSKWGQYGICVKKNIYVYSIWKMQEWECLFYVIYFLFSYYVRGRFYNGLFMCLLYVFEKEYEFLSPLYFFYKNGK